MNVVSENGHNGIIYRIAAVDETDEILDFLRKYYVSI